MSEKYHLGELRISNTSSSHDGNYITITFVDAASRSHFFDAKISFEEFGKAIGNLTADCEFRLRPEKVGLRREVKVKTVPVETTFPSQNQIDTALAEFEVDGWEARRSDLQNHHRLSYMGDGRTAYNVTFERYIKEEV